MADEQAGDAPHPQGEPAWDAELWVRALFVDAFEEASRVCNEEAFGRGEGELTQKEMQECIRDRVRKWLLLGVPHLEPGWLRGDAEVQQQKRLAMNWLWKLPQARQEELLLKHTAIV